MQLKYNKLRIYEVKKEYLNYLCEFDNNVRRKNERRYTGILVRNNNIDYCIPLTCQIKKRNPKLTIDIKDGNTIISQLTINNMIPVTEDLINMVDITNDRDKDYLNKEIQYLRKEYVINSIIEKTNNVIKVIHDENNQDYKFFKSLCANYDMLEEKCIEYINKD